MEYDWDDYEIYPPEIKRGLLENPLQIEVCMRKVDFPLPCWIDRGYSLHSSAMHMTVMGVTSWLLQAKCRPWRSQFGTVVAMSCP
jgi:hypothetical protein